MLEAPLQSAVPWAAPVLGHAASMPQHGMHTPALPPAQQHWGCRRRQPDEGRPCERPDICILCCAGAGARAADRATAGLEHHLEQLNCRRQRAAAGVRTAAAGLVRRYQRRGAVRRPVCAGPCAVAGAAAARSHWPGAVTAGL